MGSKKIKILHLNAPAGIGGAETYLLTLAKNINRQKFDLVLGVFLDKQNSGNMFWREAEKLGLPLAPIRFKKPYDLSQIQDLYRIVKKQHPDIIHTHNYKPNILGFLVAKPFGIATVATVHGLYSGENKFRTVDWVSLMLLRSFDWTIAVSDQIKEKLKTMKIPPEKIKTIRNVPYINNEEYSSCWSKFREEIGIGPNIKIIGFIGRLEPVKGCFQFIQAGSILAKRIQNICLVIIGDGSERESLEREVKQVGLENKVYFCGFRHDTAIVYKSLDLYVLPSLNEGIPLTLLEAMFYGVPVIASCVGGVPEVIQHRVNGILVRPNDPNALAESILEALNNSNETTKRIVEAKKTILNEFDVQKWIEKIQNIYLEMM